MTTVEPTRPLSVRIPERLHHGLRVLAAHERRTMSAILSELLEARLRRNGSRRRRVS